MKHARLVFLGILACSSPCSAQDAVSLQLHGQHRLLYRYSDPIGLGIPEREGESLMLLRNTVQLEAGWRGFASVVQLGGWYALGAPRLAQPPDADLGDVGLAFVEWTGANARVRVGRQEMPLGSTRWFSIRDGANVRQTFDLLRVTTRLARATLDAFAGLLPRLRRGWFDDLPNADDRVLGTYGSIPLAPDRLLVLDLYILHRQRAEQPSAAHLAGDRRTTFGLSAGGESASGAEYIQHTLLQLGERSLAWGLSAAFWQRLPIALAKVRLGLRLDALSGDKPGRGAGFDPLFPNQTFFSPHPAIFPTNLYAIHPLATVAHAGLKLEAGCILLWRQSRDDGVYEADAAITPVVGLPRVARTGAQLSLRLEYELDEHWDTELVFSRLFAGPALREAGGSDVSFFGSTLSFRY